MTDPVTHRAKAERALGVIDASDDPRNLPAGLDAIGSALLALHDLLDERLPKPEGEGVKDALERPDPDISSRIYIPNGEFSLQVTADGISDDLHALLTGTAKPAPDLTGEPVEPGDLRVGDRVAFTWMGERITGNLVSDPVGSILRSDTPDPSGYTPGIVNHREWCSGTYDVRLIERAPREDEDRDEALAMDLYHASLKIPPAAEVGPSAWDDFTRRQWLDVARAARKHIEAEWEEVAQSFEDGRDKWQAEARQQRDRAEKAEGVRAILEDRVKFWQEEKRLDNDAERSYLARAKKAEDERGAQAARAKKAEAEAKHLRERLDAFRADVERGAHHWSTFASSDAYRQRIARAAGEDLTAYLDLDDERAAKGEQR